VQLPPFEVLGGGARAGDLVTPGKRFFQYDYRLRLIAEDAFGNDVTIPPLEISYRIESQVKGGDTCRAAISRTRWRRTSGSASDLARAGRHHRHPRSARHRCSRDRKPRFRRA
jgi:hypothetical protein